MKQSFLLLLFCLPLFLLQGCSSGPAKPDGFPKDIHPCEITITQEGAPVASAMVSLTPMDEGAKNWVVGGYTGENGVVKCYTYGKWEGAPLGKYKVTVEKTIAEGPEDKEIAFACVAKKYADTKTSDLVIDIVKGKNAQKFEVGAPIKELIK